MFKTLLLTTRLALGFGGVVFLGIVLAALALTGLSSMKGEWRQFESVTMSFFKVAAARAP